jgi:hypothetical protein
MGEDQLAVAIEFEGQEQGEVFWGAKSQRQKGRRHYMTQRSSLQVEKIISSAHRERRGNLVSACIYVCGFGGFQFRDHWVPKIGTHASPSKVDQKDTTGQLITGCMIGASEGE